MRLLVNQTRRNQLAPWIKSFRLVSFRGKKKRGVTDKDVSNQVATFLGKAHTFHEAKTNVGEWVREVNSAESDLKDAKARAVDAEVLCDRNSTCKQLALKEQEKCDWEAKQLEAEKQKALRSYAARGAKIQQRKEKAESCYLEANSQTPLLMDRKMAANEDVAAAEAQLTAVKDELFLFEGPVERVGRTFAGCTGREIFEDQGIPFCFASKKYFTLESLRAFNRALGVFGYDKASMLHVKHDKTKFPDLWRDTCQVLGITMTEDHALQSKAQVAKIRSGLSALLEEARALAQAQSDGSGSVDGDDTVGEKENTFDAEGD